MKKSELRQIIREELREVVGRKPLNELLAMRDDFNVIRKSKDLYIVTPLNYEGSKWLTEKSIFNKSNWHNITNERIFQKYMKDDYTIYYISISGKLYENVKDELGSNFEMVAITVDKNGKIDAWDIDDKPISSQNFNKFEKLINFKDFE